MTAAEKYAREVVSKTSIKDKGRAIAALMQFLANDREFRVPA